MQKITVKAIIKAPLAAVWDAWVTPEDIVIWNAASDDWHTTRAEVDLRVGGTFRSRMEAKDGSVGFDFEGTYTHIAPESRIEAELGGRSLLVLFEQVDAGVLVTETFDAEETHPIELQRDGWQSILDRFAAHVESKVGP